MERLLRRRRKRVKQPHINVFKTVEILCEKFHARMILAVAELVCPEAAAKIEMRSEFLARCTEFGDCLRTVVGATLQGEK